MIAPRHNFIHEKLLTWFINWQLKRNFHQVNFSGVLQNKDKAALVIGNHISWWDGFWMHYTNQAIWGKKFHVVMLENELQKYSFFNKCGAFSINPGHVSVRETLQTIINLLNDPDNLVLFYPEGQIYSSGRFPKKFFPGIRYLLNHLPEQAQVVYSVCLTDYFSHKKPELSVYIQEADSNPLKSVDALEKAYNQFHQQCVLDQNQRTS